MDQERRAKVFQKLDELNIKYEITEHEAVYTIEEMDQLGINKLGDVVKNLFLRDDKGRRYFLVVLKNDKTVNLGGLREKLGCKLSFAQEDKLEKYLGLTKGAVSPFGVINDSDAFVEVIFDKDITSSTRIGVHPNDNTATVWVSFKDLEKVVKNNGNDITTIKI